MDKEQVRKHLSESIERYRDTLELLSQRGLYDGLVRRFQTLGGEMPTMLPKESLIDFLIG